MRDGVFCRRMRGVLPLPVFLPVRLLPMRSYVRKHPNVPVSIQPLPVFSLLPIPAGGDAHPADVWRPILLFEAVPGKLLPNFFCFPDP